MSNECAAVQLKLFSQNFACLIVMQINMHVLPLLASPFFVEQTLEAGFDEHN